MNTPIPYTQQTFNKIANSSIRMHNNQFTGNHTPGNEFVESFINDLDIYIQSNLYDVDIRNKTKNYVDHMVNKWGPYINKSIMPHIQNLDMKYVSSFKERGFIESLLVPYLYENTMITE